MPAVWDIVRFRCRFALLCVLQVLLEVPPRVPAHSSVGSSAACGTYFSSELVAFWLALAFVSSCSALASFSRSCWFSSRSDSFAASISVSSTSGSYLLTGVRYLQWLSFRTAIRSIHFDRSPLQPEVRHCTNPSQPARTQSLQAYRPSDRNSLPRNVLIAMACT